MVVSCACASSAKVFASARRMLEAGLIDAALVGGVDSLCLTTIYGFHSLQLSSASPCRPFDVARDGISIGEAAAFAWLERPPGSMGPGSILLLGVGRIERRPSHVRPAPGGHGCAARHAGGAAGGGHGRRRHRLHQPSRHRHAQQRSLGEPGRDQRFRRDHAAAVRRRAPPDIRWARQARSRRSSARSPCASGSCRAASTPRAWIPCSPRITCGRIAASPLRRVLSNSFGFGGTNCSLIFGRHRMTLVAYVNGIGVLGPGLPDWPRPRAVLSGPSALCSPRRRCSLAGATAAGRAPAHRPRRETGARGRQEATNGAASTRRPSPACSPPRAATATIATNCARSLARRPRGLADPIFATPCTTWPPAIGASPPARDGPSNVLCAFDASFGAGLIEAMTQVCGGGRLAAAGRLRYGISGAHPRQAPGARCVRRGAGAHAAPATRFARRASA